MRPWLELLAGVLALTLALGLPAALKKRRDQKRRFAEQKLELVLLPRETVKGICPQKGGRCILTSRRVLFETAQGFTAVPLKTIKKVQGMKEDGKRTTSIPRMTSLTIQAEQSYTVLNSAEEFPEFARLLLKKTEKKPKKKETSP